MVLYGTHNREPPISVSTLNVSPWFFKAQGAVKAKRKRVALSQRSQTVTHLKNWPKTETKWSTKTVFTKFRVSRLALSGWKSNIAKIMSVKRN